MLEVVLLPVLIPKQTECEFITRLENVASICCLIEEAEFLMLQYSPVGGGSEWVSVWWVASLNPLTLAQQTALDHCRMEKSMKHAG